MVGGSTENENLNINRMQCPGDHMGLYKFLQFQVDKYMWMNGAELQVGSLLEGNTECSHGFSILSEYILTSSAC